MSSKKLVIVESPTKAKTIKKFLSKEFNVMASNGHIRDLPNSASEIPPKLKKEKWAKLGVHVEQNFEPLYVIPPGKKEHVKTLKAALKDADHLYLATDEDREGESISWHIVETLKPKIPTQRLVFHEITKSAIQNSLDSAREVNQNLVKAQETRRIVDRLFGYEVSPLLWKKMSPGLSAGRVQSVAIRLLADRERERLRFKKASYWGLKASFSKTDSSKASDEFEAELTHVADKRIALGKDFDADTGKLKDNSQVLALNQAQAEQLKEKILKGKPVVNSVEEKPYSSSPAPPFVTSTLQQEANRKLRFSAKRAMDIAQKLYENGFITYMRTDSTTLSEQALQASRKLIKEDFGDEYLPPEVRIYTTKVKNAQEAHEAIRPAGDTFTSPAVVKEQLGPEAFKLYELIWMRTVASQMQNARGTHISVHVKVDDATLRAAGKTIEFPGFLRAYVEGSDDPDAELADKEKILPKVTKGESLNAKTANPAEHSTQPPARYTEGSLIKELEKRGIGRPSTWASIVELVLSRSYAFKKGTALVPSFLALAVVGLLENHFTSLLDYEFTARLEDDLDAISRGEAENIKYLHNFYYGNGHPGLRTLVETGQEEIDPRIVCGFPLGTTEDGQELEVRIGRYGPFLSNGTDRARIPDFMPPDEFTIKAALEHLIAANKEPETLGVHPETGLSIYLKTGPYGPYIQMGEQEEGGEKPKMASLLSNTAEEDVTFEYAVKLLELPKNLGAHPETKEDVIVSNGRFGPYIKSGKETRSVPLDEMSPLTMSLEQALHLLAQPKRNSRTSKPKLLRELGIHPVSELKLEIRSGRYGPYVSDGELNASLRKDMNPDTLTIEEAVDLLEARAAKVGSKKTKKKASSKSSGKSSAKSKSKSKKSSTKSTKKKATKE